MQQKIYRNLTHNIVQMVGQAIVSGKYRGANLPTEASLCEEYGVSRSILREAVKILATKGLLISRPGHGICIQSEASWHILDPDILSWLLECRTSILLIEEMVWIRSAVEPLACRLAASQRDPAGMKEVEQALQRMNAARHGDDDPLESDIALHLAILRASQNRFLLCMQDFVRVALHFSSRLINLIENVQFPDYAAHERVAVAVLEGQPEQASQAMMVIIDQAMSLVTQYKMDHPPERKL